MKITIYELLGLIKDGKAPKRIKYDNLIWILREQFNDYWDEEEYLFLTGFDEWENARDFLLEQVEILEEVEDKEYEDIEEISGDYIVPNTPATENEAYIMACFLAHEQIINALIRNQKKIIEQLKNEK